MQRKIDEILEAVAIQLFVNSQFAHKASMYGQRLGNFSRCKYLPTQKKKQGFFPCKKISQALPPTPNCKVIQRWLKSLLLCIVFSSRWNYVHLTGALIWTCKNFYIVTPNYCPDLLDPYRHTCTIRQENDLFFLKLSFDSKDVNTGNWSGNELFIICKAIL